MTAGEAELLGTFVNRISGLLDRRFLVGSWFPALLGGMLLANVLVFGYGWGKVSKAWAHLDTVPQVWVGLTIVAAVTTAAFVLHVAPTIRLFEGYGLPPPMASLGRRRQVSRRGRLPESTSLRSYPRDRSLIRPTRFGNVLTCAMEYSYLRYRIDAVVWWPRLAAILPGTFRDQIDEALLPLVTLTNVSFILLLDATAGSIWLAAHMRWIAASGVLGVLLVTAWLTYLAALSAAGSYGECIKSAFDLYRSDVLSAMHLPLPKDIIAERYLWETLTQWLHRGEPPQHSPLLKDQDVLTPDAFRYVYSRAGESVSEIAPGDNSGR